MDLTGKRILVVDDEVIVAMDLSDILTEAGAEIVGPAFSLAAALIASEGPDISVAVLDVRLGRDKVYPVAEKLAERGVGLVFHTGHGDAEALLSTWPQAHVLLKPVRAERLVEAVLKAACAQACTPTT